MTKNVVPMSERYWGLKWSEVLPWKFESGLTCEITTLDEVMPFMRAHYSRIFDGTADQFYPDPFDEAKQRYMKETDIFAIREEGELIGVFLSHPRDWSTYYLRTAAVLPDKQNRGSGLEWTARVAGVLKEAGVARFDIETAPANHRVVHILNKQGFVVTATLVSERWGVMLRFTKFLDEDAGGAFARRYCMGSNLLQNRSKQERRTQ